MSRRKRWALGLAAAAVLVALGCLVYSGIRQRQTQQGIRQWLAGLTAETLEQVTFSYFPEDAAAQPLTPPDGQALSAVLQQAGTVTLEDQDDFSLDYVLYFKVRQSGQEWSEVQLQPVGEDVYRMTMDNQTGQTLGLTTTCLVTLPGMDALLGVR